MDEDGFSEATVAVVGLGLMGGSLAAALSSRKACARVVGITRSESSLRTALDMHFVHDATHDLREGVRDADVVVLATPISDILAKIATIGPLLRPGCVLTDLGSTKRQIVAAMESLPPHVQAVGGHPMCGKETSGLAVADQALYRDKTFVLSPTTRTTIETMKTMQHMVRVIGARPLVVDPERHDRLVAAISHLPYAMAVSLVNAAESLADTDDLAWQLASSGFRDTTRLAGGNLAMMMDILDTNRDQVLHAIELAQERLSAMARSLRQDDRDGLEAMMRAARRRRLEIYG